MLKRLGGPMLNIIKLALAWLALVSAQAAFSQAPNTHQSGKEIFDRILQSEQRGRAMWDLIFKGVQVDDKKLQSNLDESVAAQNELEQLARTGDAEARYYEGLYHIHIGLADAESARQDPSNSAAPVLADREFKSAAEWLKSLAEQGNPQAQWQYGELFANGRGVNKSSSNAIDWWFKAAQTFLKKSDREDALTLFDMMRNADQSSPRVAQLQKALFPN